MARYRGTVQGSKGQADRLGSSKSGLKTEANGWSIGATVQIHENIDRSDIVNIYATTGSSPEGKKLRIARMYEQGGKVKIDLFLDGEGKKVKSIFL